MVAENPALAKIAEQSSWYGKRSRESRRVYVALKTIQIVFAAAIPVVSAFAQADRGKWLSAILGASIGIIEGILQLGRYQENWLLFRATREALRRENLLYLGKSGPYASELAPDRLFIERADSIMSGENSRWLVPRQGQTEGQ